MVTGVTRIGAAQLTQGFYVTASPTEATSSTIGRGDLIVELNFRALRPTDAARAVLTAPELVSVTVVRKNSEEHVIVVPKTVVRSTGRSLP